VADENVRDRRQAAADERRGADLRISARSHVSELRGVALLPAFTTEDGERCARRTADVRRLRPHLGPAYDGGERVSEPWWNRVYLGSCERMDAIPDASVHCIVTSPPYYGLRAYLPDNSPNKAKEIGLEPTLAEFIERLCCVFDECRRVLRDDGTMFVNMGDSYATRGTRMGNRHGNLGDESRDDIHRSGYRPCPPKFKEKDLMLVPYRLALALQERGWWVRDNIVWAKPNPMPSSVTDRCTSSHEAIFMLSKSARYFSDMDAVREPYKETESYKYAKQDTGKRIGGRQPGGTYEVEAQVISPNPLGANLRNVWTIATEAYSDAHFATFPREIPARCIRIGTSEAGCCAECGAPRRRVVDVEYVKSPVHGLGSVVGRHYETGANNFDGAGMPPVNKRTTTVGFEPSCEHAAESVPCIVLDPFMGSGTVAEVAESLGRRWVGYELNEEYHALIAERTRQAGLFAGGAG